MMKKTFLGPMNPMIFVELAVLYNTYSFVNRAYNTVASWWSPTVTAAPVNEINRGTNTSNNTNSTTFDNINNITNTTATLLPIAPTLMQYVGSFGVNLVDVGFVYNHLMKGNKAELASMFLGKAVSYYGKNVVAGLLNIDPTIVDVLLTQGIAYGLPAAYRLSEKLSPTLGLNMNSNNNINNQNSMQSLNEKMDNLENLLKENNKQPTIVVKAIGSIGGNSPRTYNNANPKPVIFSKNKNNKDNKVPFISRRKTRSTTQMQAEPESVAGPIIVKPVISVKNNLVSTINQNKKNKSKKKKVIKNKL